MLPDQLTKYLLALTFAVSPRSIVEVASEFNRSVERLIKLGVVSTCPTGQAPHAIANFAYVELCASKSPVLHSGMYTKFVRVSKMLAPKRMSKCAGGSFFLTFAPSNSR